MAGKGRGVAGIFKTNAQSVLAENHEGRDAPQDVRAGLGRQVEHEGVTGG
jgi:hypothetical protein